MTSGGGEDLGYRSREVIADHLRWQESGGAKGQAATVVDERLDLSRTRMAGIELYDIVLEGASFAHADLSQASLQGRFAKCDFTDADLRMANVSKSYFGGADLTRAYAPGLNGLRAEFFGAVAIGINLERANLRLTMFSDANLRDAHLAGAVIEEASLSGADLRGADLTNAQIGNTFVNGARFGGAALDGVQGVEQVVLDLGHGKGDDFIDIGLDAPEMLYRDDAISWLVDQVR